jgi:hypothetical protein
MVLRENGINLGGILHERIRGVPRARQDGPDFLSDAPIDLAAGPDCHYSHDLDLVFHREDDSPASHSRLPEIAFSGQRAGEMWIVRSVGDVDKLL